MLTLRWLGAGKPHQNLSFCDSPYPRNARIFSDSEVVFLRFYCAPCLAGAFFGVLVDVALGMGLLVALVVIVVDV